MSLLCKTRFIFTFYHRLFPIFCQTSKPISFIILFISQVHFYISFFFVFCFSGTNLFLLFVYTSHSTYLFSKFTKKEKTQEKTSFCFLVLSLNQNKNFVYGYGWICLYVFYKLVLKYIILFYSIHVNIWGTPPLPLMRWRHTCMIPSHKPQTLLVL